MNISLRIIHVFKISLVVCEKFERHKLYFHLFIPCRNYCFFFYERNFLKVLFHLEVIKLFDCIT